MSTPLAPGFVRIPLAEIELGLITILIKHGFSPLKAGTCADIFAGNSLDGVYSHGVNRFAKFIKYVEAGLIKPDLEAVCKCKAGSIEQWEGQSGPGPINAKLCMERAVEIAAVNGMGCVALANTNHWLRGGTYGWMAARKGYIYIGWSNTIANMPAWGAVNPKLGNNPLVIAVPYQGEAIVLDMAVSQYSYGALEVARMKNEELAVPGGYDKEGNTTRNPNDILTSQRSLPIGYWKGAGLSFLLDILATVLSGGLSTGELSKEKSESRVSQVFIAINPAKLQSHRTIASAIDVIMDDYRQSISETGKTIRYPGEQILKIRAENMEKGVPVAKAVWEEIQML